MSLEGVVGLLLQPEEALFWSNLSLLSKAPRPSYQGRELKLRANRGALNLQMKQAGVTQSSGKI